MTLKQIVKNLFPMIPILLLAAGCKPTTPRPMPEPSPTATVRPTSTATRTPSPTYGPTLPAEQVQANVMALLESNGGCQFPCWWGIVPGKTLWEDGDRSLRQIGFTPELYPPTGVYYDLRNFTGSEEGIEIDFEIHLKSNLIDFIIVNSEGSDNPGEFDRIWKNASPQSIISTYSTPSRVWLHSYKGGCEGGDPCNYLPYWLNFFYDKQGFSIGYYGSVANMSIYTFCPAFRDAGNLVPAVKIILKPQNDPRAFENLREPSSTLGDGVLDLTAATGLTLDEFAALFNQNGQSACFTTPRDIWP